VALDGSDLHALDGTPLADAHSPRFSPDGGRILYELGSADILETGDIDRIESIDAAGGGRAVVYAESVAPAMRSRVQAGGWSPDGARVVFSRCPADGGPCELVIAASDGSRHTLFLAAPTGTRLGLRTPDWRLPP
jgi:hypothetical protein